MIHHHSLLFLRHISRFLAEYLPDKFPAELQMAAPISFKRASSAVTHLPKQITQIMIWIRQISDLKQIMVNRTRVPEPDQ